MKVTGAVGLPPYAGVTVAVNVTACPPLEGLGVDASVVVVEARLTVTLIAVELLPINVVFPAYTAVIECVLTPSPETVNVAVPDFNATLPIVLLPSWKTTEPVGVPPAGALTVAVRTTGWLNSDAFGDALRTVVVLTGFTVWLTAAELLGAEFNPPTKLATTLCVPAASVETTSVA